MYDDVVDQGVPDRFAALLRQFDDQPAERGEVVAPMALTREMHDAVLATIPSLRAFAVSLCGNVDRADDLVQETLVRAIANIDRFQPGTNLSAWLFTILRNHFRSEFRKRRREVEDADGKYTDSLKAEPGQIGNIEFAEFKRGVGAVAAGPARGAGPGRRLGLLLRGSGQHLRLRGRHDQEPGQPRAQPSGRTDGDRRGHGFRTRRRHRAAS